MKLVATTGRDHDGIRLKKQPGADCSWLWAWWKPTEEDYVGTAELTHEGPAWIRGSPKETFRGGENDFPKLLTFLLPADSYAYAQIFLHTDEIPELIRHLGERHFAYEIQKLGRWSRFLLPTLTHPEIRFQADARFVAYAFQYSMEWIMGTWTVLLSNHPLEKWKIDLKIASGRTITSDFVASVDLCLRNNWEHGFDMLSGSLTYAELLGITRRAAQNIGWVFEEE